MWKTEGFKELQSWVWILGRPSPQNNCRLHGHKKKSENLSCRAPGRVSQREDMGVLEDRAHSRAGGTCSRDCDKLYLHKNKANVCSKRAKNLARVTELASKPEEICLSALPLPVEGATDCSPLSSQERRERETRTLQSPFKVVYPILHRFHYLPIIPWMGIKPLIQGL